MRKLPRFTDKLEIIENWFAILITVAVSCIVYYRLHFGVSIADESFYTTTALLPAMGGKWYVNEMLFQQTANMLFAPFVMLYKWLFGTTGIILFVRHLHFIFSLFVGFQLFQLLKKFNRWSVALLLSSAVITFVPHGIQSLSYNSLGSLLFGLASIFSVRAYMENSKKLAILAGIMWVLDGYSYPSLMICFFVFFPIAWFLTRKDPEKNKTFFLPMFWGAASTTTILILILLSLGIENIFSSIEFSQEFALPGAAWKIPLAYSLIWKYFPPPSVVVAFLVSWLFLGKWKEEASVYLWAIFLAIFFIFGGRYEAFPVQVLYPIVQFFFAIYIFTKHEKFSALEKVTILFIILPAIAGSIAGCLSSRLTLYIMGLTGVFGALALISMVIGKNRIIGIFISAMITSFACAQLFEIIYEDDSFEHLNYKITSGPLAGLHTFEEKVKFIEAIQNDLRQYNINGKLILFKDYFPIGYLMADNIPSGPSLYIAPAIFFPEVRHLYLESFGRLNWVPEVVVELLYYPVRKGERWEYFQNRIPDLFKNFMYDSGRYSVLVERDTHRILIKR